MRLISQNGMIDVPYENVIIACENNRDGKYTIYARCSHCLGMATYSTKDKALNVLEMLRKQYMNLGMIKILASGTCEYMDKSLERKEKMGIYADYCKKHCFKFPNDEEMED